MTTLSISRTEAERHLARFLGWNPDKTKWNATQQADCDLIVAKGLRWFYNPPVLPNEAHNHTWSFLKPEFRIVTKTGVGDYDLPEDFGGIEGNLTFSPTDSAWRDVVQVSEYQIRSLRTSSVQSTGYPEFFATQPLPSDGDEPQRTRLMLWPTPQDQRELSGTYLSNPLLITGDKPWPLGNQPHSEAVLAAIMAAAESFYEDRRGEKYAEYIECLRSSVSYDRRMTGPHFFGENKSSLKSRRTRATRATYEGVSYP